VLLTKLIVLDEIKIFLTRQNFSKNFKKTKLLENKSEVLVFIRNTFSTFLRKEITLDF
jgi:hypothetical protein